MHQTSDITFESIIQTLKKEELGFLLLQANQKSMYNILASIVTYKDRQSMFCPNEHIVYHLYPLCYNKNMKTKDNLAQNRNDAIQTIFARWTNKGYNKHHAKNPYACKNFIKYLNKIKFTQADYMISLCETIISSDLKEISIPMSLATFTTKSEQLQKLSNQYKCSFLGYDDVSALADFGWSKQCLNDSQIPQFIIDLEQILNN